MSETTTTDNTNYARFKIESPINKKRRGKCIRRNTYHFYVPKDCISMIFNDFHNDKDRFYAMRILAFLQVSQKKHDVFSINDFAPMASNTLQIMCGSGYTKYMDYLKQEAKLIEAFMIDGVEHFEKGDDGREPQCKKYRFTKQFDFQKVVWTVFDAIPDGSFPKDVQFTPNGKYDEELLYCLQFERKLRLDVAGFDEVDASDIGLFSQSFNAFVHGNFVPNVQDESTRFYVPSTGVKNRHKRYLRYDGKEELANYDIICCYYSILQELTSSEDYCKQYKINNSNNSNNNSTKLLENNNLNKLHMFSNGTSDFFENLGSNLGFPREKVKELFYSFCNTNWKCPQNNIQKHPFYKRLVEAGGGYEKIARFIENTDEVWKILEQFETEILSKLICKCMIANIPVGRSHDGFILRKSDVAQVEPIVKEIESDYKFIRFKQKPLDELDTNKKDLQIDESNLCTCKPYQNVADIEDSLWILKRIRGGRNSKGKNTSDLDAAIEVMQQHHQRENEKMSVSGSVDAPIS